MQKLIVKSISIITVITLIFGSFILVKNAEAQVQTVDSFKTTKQDTTLSMINAAAAVTAECLTGLIASQLAAWTLNLLASLLPTGGGGLLSLEVPVKESAVRSKEVGSGPIGAIPSLDGALYCVVEVIMTSVLRSLTEWIKGGAKGSPLFIENPSFFFDDMADKSWGETLQNLVGPESDLDLCSNFKVSINAALLYNLSTKEPEKCRLSTILGEEGAIGGGVVDDFVSGDFAKGGWRSWFNLTQVNNPYQAVVDVKTIGAKKIQDEKNTWKMTLTWGDGWPRFSDEDGNTTTPGDLIQRKIENTLHIPYGKLEVADEFNELITTTINMLVKSLFENFTNSPGDIVM